jgi:hypothetical protein
VLALLWFKPAHPEVFSVASSFEAPAWGVSPLERGS